jgi:hypothetical protein
LLINNPFKDSIIFLLNTSNSIFLANYQYKCKILSYDEISEISRKVCTYNSYPKCFPNVLLLNDITIDLMISKVYLENRSVLPYYLGLSIGRIKPNNNWDTDSFIINSKCKILGNSGGSYEFELIKVENNWVINRITLLFN